MIRLVFTGGSSFGYTAGKILKRLLVMVVMCSGLAACDGDEPLVVLAELSGADSALPDDPIRCNRITYLAPSGAWNNITFVLNEPYTCGQFANGDWWVSPNQRGYVQIDRILPDRTNGLHGYEVNPQDNARQPFDRRIKGYEETLAQAFPLRIRTNAAVVKAVSKPPEKAGKACRPCLVFAAVLTVTESPIAGSRTLLRPSYFGKTKTLYSLNGIETLAGRQLKTGCCDAADMPTITWIKERYQGVQLDHLQGWNGRDMHPEDNMPDYGASIARDNAVAVLRMLLSDFQLSNVEHRAALINYLQLGVDLEGMALNGVSWPAAGGHGNGRKLPLVFGDWLLSDANWGTALKTAAFSEDEQVYWSKAAGRALFGQKCTDSGYWSRMRTGAGAKDCRDPYGYIDGGGRDIGAAYQLCCTAKPWKYTALAVSILRLDRRWNRPAFSNYVHRWVKQGVWAEPDPCAPFNGNPQDYKKAYGPDGSGGCIRGGGRQSDTQTGLRHRTKRDAGHYGSEFADELWAWYWRKG